MYEEDLITVSYTYNKFSGLKEGVFGEWHFNGVKAKVCTYKNGKLVGSYKEWYEDGIPKIHCTYRTLADGEEIGDDEEEFCGEYQEWHANGTVKTDRLYSPSGKRIEFSATFHYNGEKESYEHYNKNGVKIGVYYEWHVNGKTRKSCIYDFNGNINGEYRESGEDGKTIRSIMYSHGKKHGNSYEYMRSGRIASKEEYNNDILLSRYIYFGGQQNDYLYSEYNEDGVFKHKKRAFPATYMIKDGIYHISYVEHNNNGVFNIEDGHSYYKDVCEDLLTCAEQ
jgi:antitoxin component YwqK of YwqJK toxin-antitoxin module